MKGLSCYYWAQAIKVQARRRCRVATIKRRYDNNFVLRVRLENILIVKYIYMDILRSEKNDHLIMDKSFAIYL